MIRHDLVGHNLRVVAAKNKDLVGISGEIVEETKQTLRVRTDGGEKTLIKEQVTIDVQGTIIEGELLTVSPEKRTKLKITRWQRKKPQKQ